MLKIITAILFPSFCFSQVKTKHNDVYGGVSELRTAGKIQLADLFGTYQIYNGFAGIDLQLDSTFKYMLSVYDCTERDTAIRGKWVFQNGQIVAKGAVNERFDIVRFRNYLLLIPLSSKAAVLTRFRQELIGYLDDNTLTDQEADFISRSIYRRKI